MLGYLAMLGVKLRIRLQGKHGRSLAPDDTLARNASSSTVLPLAYLKIRLLHDVSSASLVAITPHGIRPKTALTTLPERTSTSAQTLSSILPHTPTAVRKKMSTAASYQHTFASYSSKSYQSKQGDDDDRHRREGRNQDRLAGQRIITGVHPCCPQKYRTGDRVCSQRYPMG